MKIDFFTLSVLENFAIINPALWINEGNQLMTASATKAVIARANVDAVFPKSFGLYRLAHLIQVLGLYKEPDISFENTHLLVADAARSTKIVYGDPALFELFQKAKAVKFPSSNIKASMSSVVLTDLAKAARILSAPDVIIQGNGTELLAFVTKADEANSSYHKIRLGETDRIFKAVIKYQNLTLLPLDYEVEIVADKKHPCIIFAADRITYQIALDGSSEL